MHLFHDVSCNTWKFHRTWCWCCLDVDICWRPHFDMWPSHTSFALRVSPVSCSLRGGGWGWGANDFQCLLSSEVMLCYWYLLLHLPSEVMLCYWSLLLHLPPEVLDATLLIFTFTLVIRSDATPLIINLCFSTCFRRHSMLLIFASTLAIRSVMLPHWTLLRHLPSEVMLRYWSLLRHLPSEVMLPHWTLLRHLPSEVMLRYWSMSQEFAEVGRNQ